MTTPPQADAPPVEMEVFYTFVWAPRPRGGDARGARNRPERQGDRAPRPTQDRPAQDRPTQDRPGQDRPGHDRKDRHRPDRNVPDAAMAPPGVAAPEDAQAAAEPARSPRTDRGERPAGGDGRRRDAPRSGGKERGAEGGYKGKPKPRGGNPSQDRPERSDRPDRSNDRAASQNQPKTFESRPPKTEKIDPDNPFAVLAALRLKS